MSTVDVEKYQDLSDLSDKEDAEDLDFSPFTVGWLDLSPVGYQNKLGVCSLPGAKYKKNWRSLPFDINCLKESSVQDIFCLCTKGELHLYRVPDLIEMYTAAGFTVHHHSIEDGMAPSTDELIPLLETIKGCLVNKKNVLIHCYGGMGRSCLVAMCLFMYLDNNITAEEIRDKIKKVRGERADGSVKQYNYVNEFRETLESYRKDKCKEISRSASR